MADDEPLVELIMIADDGLLASKACERIWPRLRAVAKNWESTSKARFVCRKMALDIATSMDYAAAHPDIVFLIAE